MSEGFMNWIKCSERMPEAGIYVLALLNGSPQVLFFDPRINIWDDGDFHSFIKPSNVTHWMPLPQPPEE